MNIGLIDVDGCNYPNLALMKISRYEKTKGNTVNWYNPLMYKQFDKVYASKIFTFTKDYLYMPEGVIKGGSGYDIEKKLPEYIDSLEPDYSIYPRYKELYGFLSRGCPNRCPWCIVPRKEGFVKPYSDVDKIASADPNRKDLILMDNNFLANDLEFIKEQTEKIKKHGFRVDFNQATDARLYTEETARIMSKIRYIKYIRISCDTDNMIKHCIHARDLMRGYGYKGEIFTYILAKSGVDNIESALMRIAKLTEYDSKFVPFVMPYRDISGKNSGSSEYVVPQDLKRLARWCNRVWIRKSCSFKDYKG